MTKSILPAAIASLLLAATAGAATANVAPLRASVSDRGNAVAAGTDIFWTSQRKSNPEPKYGYTYTSSLWRSSFLGGPKTLLKRFDPKDTATGFPEKILAGGAYVYVNMFGDGSKRDELNTSTTVLRMSRDGSGLQKVASGELAAGEEDETVREGKKVLMNDCGTSVEAQMVTSDGSVVIRETKSERESRACGRKKNVDHYRYILVSPAGITREILTERIRISNNVRIDKIGGFEGTSGPEEQTTFILNVLGDRALIVRGESPAYYLRDLNTGIESGPFNTPIKGKYPFGAGTIDPFGRVAVSTIIVSGTSRKTLKAKVSSGVFQRPGDSASFVPAKGRSFLMFCGRHLIALSSKGARELDPVTLNLLRPIAPVHKDGSAVYLNNPCSDEYLYMIRSKGRGSTFLAYPLGP